MFFSLRFAYTDGAPFVFDLREGGVKDNPVAEGPRKLTGVMQVPASTENRK